jgi:regulatory protein
VAECSARSYALNLIKRRLRSVGELDESLKRREVPREERESLIQELETAGLLDDHRFAQAWVNDRDRFKPRGEAVLRLELMKKRVPKNVIDQVLRDRVSREEDAVDEVRQAREIIRSRLRTYANLELPVRHQRLLALLMRRGFRYETAAKALRQATGSEGSAED